ncbi:MAG: hypothetical protein ACK5XC_18995, partial [Pseudanabaena sp.]
LYLVFIYNKIKKNNTLSKKKSTKKHQNIKKPKKRVAALCAATLFWVSVITVLAQSAVRYS